MCWLEKESWPSLCWFKFRWRIWSHSDHSSILSLWSRRLNFNWHSQPTLFQARQVWYQIKALFLTQTSTWPRWRSKNSLTKNWPKYHQIIHGMFRNKWYFIIFWWRRSSCQQADLLLTVQFSDLIVLSIRSPPPKKQTVAWQRLINLASFIFQNCNVITKISCMGESFFTRERPELCNINSNMERWSFKKRTRDLIQDFEMCETTFGSVNKTSLPLKRCLSNSSMYA